MIFAVHTQTQLIAAVIANLIIFFSFRARYFSDF